MSNTTDRMLTSLLKIACMSVESVHTVNSKSPNIDSSDEESNGAYTCVNQPLVSSFVGNLVVRWDTAGSTLEEFSRTVPPKLTTQVCIINLHTFFKNRNPERIVVVVVVIRILCSQGC